MRIMGPGYKDSQLSTPGIALGSRQHRIVASGSCWSLGEEGLFRRKVQGEAGMMRTNSFPFGSPAKCEHITRSDQNMKALKASRSEGNLVGRSPVSGWVDTPGGTGDLRPDHSYRCLRPQGFASPGRLIGHRHRGHLPVRYDELSLVLCCPSSLVSLPAGRAPLLLLDCAGPAKLSPSHTNVSVATLACDCEA
ncbi:uncharacterized protein BO80DRAFT_73963 [Aspergillus ibericus CBS 121593]|uniref:Uncharacterized protein n=1 Tax=Aspergillus ibericus CBS 121593 TaxID=1448316 RepID=A0A395HDL1_9EURO|nr:hypothetical protein BO80DRAFT_73963 [Aspergillus ibericus CBS 121593]RAL05589.1 hypothetical protein BO80DRAFT_73963 [Aspergillus ibericus CBS 121593]